MSLLALNEDIGPVGLPARPVVLDENYIMRCPTLRNWLRPTISPKRVDIGTNAIQWFDSVTHGRRVYGYAQNPQPINPPVHSSADANFNGQPTLTNAGDTYTLLRPSIASDFSLNLDACTLIFPVRPTHTGLNYFLGYPGTPTGAQPLRIGFTSGSGRQQYLFLGNAAGNARLIYTGAEFQNTTNIAAVRISKATGVHLHVNGTLVASAPSDLDGLTYAPWQFYGLGNGGGGAQFRGSHADVLTFDGDLTMPPMTGWWNGIHQYLGMRYGKSVTKL